MARKKLEKKLDPILFAVLKARIDGIVNEMTDVLLRTSRNPILYGAKDFTCGMFSYDARLLTMANSIAVHIYGNRNSVRSIAKFFEGDLHPGDVFVNSSPYHGANHYGDWTMATPIFNEGEIVGWTGNLCHLIDCGAHVPTNLDPYAKDVYEEGLHLPPIRLVKENKEIPDLINLIKANFRYPEQWHGDFLAQVGSVRKGAEEITKLCQKYGNSVIKQFQDDFILYGDQRMTEEIKKMPRGTWSINDISEKWEGFFPKGLRLEATVSIEPDEGMIYFDLTGMDDQVNCGFNCSRSTAEGACIWSTLACVDPDLPRNDGVYKHFKIKLREGSVCGIPKWPVGTSLATFCCSDEVSGMLYRLWEKVKSGMGHASGGEVNGAQSVCSGIDFRHNNEPYGHLFYVAMSGGPGTKDCDGWPEWLHNGALGNQNLESVELVELSVPVIVWEVGVAVDSGGAGHWRGAIGETHRIQPRKHTMKIIPCSTGHNHPPRGVSGGLDGHLADHWIEDHKTGEKLRQLQNFGYFEAAENEDWKAITNGGGGYGNPLERDPEMVRDDVRNGFVSLKAARELYGVVIYTKSELYSVDMDLTLKTRTEMKNSRSGLDKSTKRNK